MSVPLCNGDREAQLRALLAELATKLEAFAAEQARLLSEKEVGVQHAVSGGVREIVLWQRRAAFLMKFGITLIGVPAQVYATFVTSSVVHAGPHASLPAAALMAVVACCQHIALWRRPCDLVQCSVASHAMRRLERRPTLMCLDVHPPAMAIDWRLGRVKWEQRGERDAAGIPTSGVLKNMRYGLPPKPHFHSQHSVQQSCQREIVGPRDTLWHADPNGEFFAVVDDLRLIIRSCDGFARYLILQRGARDIMLGSGTEIDVSKAMVAAQRAAERTRFILAQRARMRAC
jgi:hypothetical protein